MLEVTNLECERGDRRLFTALDFSLQAGELLHVSGPNGAGKTTLLRAVCGLVAPTVGGIRWGGEDIRALGDDYRRHLTYLGHLPAVKDELTAVENLQIAGALAAQLPGKAAVVSAVHRLGLAGYEDLPAKVLSQGQRRRLALARLLLGGTRLWVLDEPFTALDTSAIEVLRAVLDEHLEGGGLIILTTHQEMGLAKTVTRRITLGP